MGPMVPTLLLTIALAAASAAGQQVAPDPKLVRVWITTEEGGQSQELAGRRESIKHLTEALAKQKKLVALVDKEDEADVTLEVKERRVDVPRIVFGVGGRPGDPLGTTAPARTVQLLVQLGWQREDVDIRNKNKPLESGLGWSSAADDVVKQVTKWIADHRQQILDGR